MRVRTPILEVSLALAALATVHATAQTEKATSSLPPYPVGLSTALGQRVHDLLVEPDAAQAHWGIAVTTLDGVPVLGVDEGRLFRPASTAKLFTTAAALALLGPETRFATRVYGNLDPSTGVVQGDLTLVGGGDPSFGTEDLPYRHESQEERHNAEVSADDSLARLADKVVAAGVKRVTGHVVGDDTLFEAASVPEGWAEEDLRWGYGTLPSALSLNDNQFLVTIEAPSTKPPTGQQAVVTLNIDQLYPYLQVSNDVRSVAAGEENDVDIQNAPRTPQAIRVFGHVADGAKPLREQIALYDSAGYAAGALRALLKERQTLIPGEAKALHRPPSPDPLSFLSDVRAPGCEPSLWGQGSSCSIACSESGPGTHLLAEHLSRSLADDVAFTMKTSANLHAEILLHHLGRKASCMGGTTLEGSRVLRAWLLHIGVQETDFVLYDGSGLSTKDLVTPRAQAHLLVYAATQSWFPQWLAALPVGGVDGTLASRFAELPLKGNVLAKTGTLGETRALAGYVRCASGKRMIFSILVDDHQPGSTADRVVMDKIVSAIAQYD